VNFVASNFEKRRVHELGETAGYFGFTNACGSMRMMLFGMISSRKGSGVCSLRQRFRIAIATDFFAAPLTDNVAVEFAHDFPRGEFV
jgi:hypothetical protein